MGKQIWGVQMYESEWNIFYSHLQLKRQNQFLFYLRLKEFSLKKLQNQTIQEMKR